MRKGLGPLRTFRDSDVTRLGRVPAHWDVRRLKHWVAVNRSVLPDDTDADYVLDYLDIGSVATGHLVAPPEQMRFGDAPSRARRIVRLGDTIVSTVRTYLKAVWHAEQVPGLIASTGFAVLTPRSDTWPKFVSYVCQSQSFTDRVTESSVGVAYPAISETRLGLLAVGVPPLAEQAEIADFLDHVTDKIDRYIQAKEKLLILLEEHKQAAIEDAVTGHAVKWREVRLRSVVTTIQIGPFGSQLHASEYTDGGTPVINPSHMADGRILPDPSVSVDQSKAEELSIHRLRVNDVVMARRGELGRCALVGVAEEGWICGTGSLRVRPDTAVILSGFLVLCLMSRSVREALTAASIGATMENVNVAMVSRLRIPLPALDDQAAVVESLADLTARLDELSDRVGTQMLAMKEYRGRLVADVVTGKTDVRQAAAKSDGRRCADTSGNGGQIAD